MAVPVFYEFIDSVLRILRDHGGPMHRREVRAQIPKRMGLSDEDMKELAGEKGKSRGVTKWADRTGWAISYSGKLGWVEAVSRGNWRITEHGRQLLADYPAGISTDFLREQVSRIRNERRAAREERAGSDEQPAVSETDVSIDPEESIRSAYEEHRSAVADAVLAQVRAADPLFFEHLVLKLLNAMGYGADESSLEQTGGSGDGGIDGVISLDKLGLERVSVCAGEAIC